MMTTFCGMGWRMDVSGYYSQQQVAIKFSCSCLCRIPCLRLACDGSNHEAKLPPESAAGTKYPNDSRYGCAHICTLGIKLPWAFRNNESERSTLLGPWNQRQDFWIQASQRVGIQCGLRVTS